MARVYNFSAGPAVLPEEVLREAADEMLDYKGSGQSVMEKLDRKCNEIIAIADLGLWNGRRTGYKDYRHLQDIMYTSCDYEKIYVDVYGNLRKRESHHDGANTILYRQWKGDITDIQKDNFRNKCYEGCLTKQDIYRYTKSLGKLFCEYYGW